jgi:hypothetical protein
MRSGTDTWTGGRATCGGQVNGWAPASGFAAAHDGRGPRSRTGRARAGRLPRGPNLAGDFFALAGRPLGGCRCHTRADSMTSSFSVNEAIRHHVRGSDMYRSWELTSSGSRLFSMTGLVVSQVRTPGGST